MTLEEFAIVHSRDRIRFGVIFRFLFGFSPSCQIHVLVLFEIAILVELNVV